MLDIIYSTDYIRYPLTGIGRYSFELAKKLQQCKDKVNLTFIDKQTISNSLPLNVESAVSNISSFRRRLRNINLLMNIYKLSYPLVRSLLLKKYDRVIYHSPHFLLPLGIKNGIATFHDLSVFHCPQFCPAEQLRLLQKEIPKTVQRARALITISYHTRDQVVEFFNINPVNIHVTPLGYNQDFYPRNKTASQAILKKYQLGWRSYFLYTGTIEPRKNILTLLQAYERLEMNEKQRFPLVISGCNGWMNENLFKLFDKAEREGWLRYLGFVPSTALPVLYSAARAFVFPSFYEGFGLPVLEAMASGTPVICSNAASLPEVVGDAALLHAPTDVELLTQHLKKMINDSMLHQQLAEAGLARAKQFSWDHCADKTIEAYEQVAKFL